MRVSELRIFVHNTNDHRKAIQNARRAYGKNCVCTMRIMRVIRRKMADSMYGHPREGALDFGNGAFPEKTPQNFDLRCPLSIYMAALSRRTKAPEVRCDLADTQTHGNYRNPRCACAPRVNDSAKVCSKRVVMFCYSQRAAAKTIPPTCRSGSRTGH